jgi:hypothetical protein
MKYIYRVIKCNQCDVMLILTTCGMAFMAGMVLATMSGIFNPIVL